MFLKMVLTVFLMKDELFLLASDLATASLHSELKLLLGQLDSIPEMLSSNELQISDIKQSELIGYRYSIR